MKLTEHFDLSEFTFSQTAVRNGIDNSPDAKALNRLMHTAIGMEDVRTLLDKPIRISSGFRCLKLNRTIGSKDNSAHVNGDAVDFTCPGVGSPRVVATLLAKSKINFDQLILEGVSDDNPDGSWVHISFATTMRREILTMRCVGHTSIYQKGIV